MSNESVLAIVLTLTGAVLGGALASFAALLADRLPRGLSAARPSSTCATCASPLAWRDKLPVVSFLALRGRCRRCGAKISRHLLILEVAGGLIGGAIVTAALRPFG